MLGKVIQNPGARRFRCLDHALLFNHPVDQLIPVPATEPLLGDDQFRMAARAMGVGFGDAIGVVQHTESGFFGSPANALH